MARLARIGGMATRRCRNGAPPRAPALGRHDSPWLSPVRSRAGCRHERCRSAAARRHGGSASGRGGRRGGRQAAGDSGAKAPGARPGRAAARGNTIRAALRDRDVATRRCRAGATESTPVTVLYSRLARDRGGRRRSPSAPGGSVVPRIHPWASLLACGPREPWRDIVPGGPGRERARKRRGASTIGSSASRSSGVDPCNPCCEARHGSAAEG
jgi:hypothetical protein